MLGAGQPFRVGQAAGGDDHGVRPFAQHLVRRGVAVEPDIHAEPFQLRRAPIHNGDQVAPPRGPHGQQQLPAQAAAGLEQHDLVAPFGGDARRSIPPGPAADHDDAAAWLLRGRDDLGHGLFAAGCRVMDTVGLAVHAIGRADAGADPFLLAAHQLVDDLRIGHMRPRHRHHVQ